MAFYFAVVAVQLLMLQLKESECALPYQSIDAAHMRHILELEPLPLGPPDRAAIRQKVQQLPSTYIPQTDWLPPSHGLGTVSAVAFDNADNVVVFHRGDHVWSQQTFDPLTNIYRGDRHSPIAAPTMMAYSRRTGAVAYRLGTNLFHMPHGLTIDGKGFIYATDVALHQVLKLSRRHDDPERLAIEWTLGRRFQPGHSDDTFCKPTAVAVLPNGDFFVADGYCNARILKYSADVKLLLKWGVNSFSGAALATAPPNFFSIPHALTLAPDRGWLCVADREHGRVQCFDQDGVFLKQFHSPLMGDRLFSVAYAPVSGGRLYVVNGPDLGLVRGPDGSGGGTEVLGFVVDVESGEVVAKFTPQTRDGRSRLFGDPHDVIVSPDGIEVYVADLDNMAYKLVSADPAMYNKSMEFVKLTAAATTTDRKTVASADSTASTLASSRRQRSTVLLIASLTGVFVCLIVVLALVIARRRSRRESCCACFCGRVRIIGNGKERRRHAWDFPIVSAESLRMGIMRDDGKGNFEKLNQEDTSDVETSPGVEIASGGGGADRAMGGSSSAFT